MASAPNPIDCEGKILASAADLCGYCDQQIAVKHCTICPLDLCVICAKGHVKVPATRDHQLTDITQAGSAAKSTKASARNGSCTKHGDQQFTILCKDCVELGCDSCGTYHSSHSIQTLDGDPKLCHRVVGKNIQRLLDDVHILEEIKSVLEGQICAYDGALVRVDQWEVDLLKLVKEKANKIRRQLKDLKDERYKQLSDRVNGVMAKLKVIDQSITQMTAIRKSMDFTSLSTSLSKSQDLIRSLIVFKEVLKPLPEPISVDDVLPSGEKIKDVDSDLGMMFMVGTKRMPTKGPMPVAEWHFTSSNGGKDLSVYGMNHVIMTNVTYGPGPDGEAQGAVVVTNGEDASRVVMNPNDKLMFSGDMTFFIHMIETDATGGPLFAYDTGVTSSRDLGTYIYSHSDYLEIQSGVRITTPYILTPKSWQKIVIVFKQTKVSVFVNGKLAHDENCNMDLSKTHRGHLYFGRKPGWHGFNGRIASSKFFDVALDENEIKNL